jgi:glycosyltransferase involved in cell wall biosynthesis
VIHVLELRSVFGTGGGPEKTILYGAVKHDRARFHVRVCYLRGDDDQAFQMRSRAEALGVEYVEVSERYSVDPRIWRQLRDITAKDRFDIIHAHDYKTNLLALLLARGSGAIALSTAHGWTGQSWRERRVYYPGDKRLLIRFPRVIAVSNEIRNELISRGADAARVEVILNGIDPDRFRRQHEQRRQARELFGLGADALVVGAVGRLERQKRFDLLLEAAAELVPRHPRLIVAIAGDGTLAGQLRDQAGRLGLGDHCRLLGHVADVRLLHHASDLFVQSSEYEGTPNVVLEAMAMETPIVATDVGGTADLMRDGIDGLLIPSGDVSRLREAIDRMLSDTSLASSLSRSARSRVESDLTFAARVRRVESLYTELVEARPARVAV